MSQVFEFWHAILTMLMWPDAPPPDSVLMWPDAPPSDSPQTPELPHATRTALMWPDAPPSDSPGCSHFRMLHELRWQGEDRIQQLVGADATLFTKGRFSLLSQFLGLCWRIETVMPLQG
jgi:hypothetical protein